MEEPRKPMTVQALPPEVGGVVPDSKPPSLMMVVGQVLGLVVGAERAMGRRERVERRMGRRMLVGIGIGMGGGLCFRKGDDGICQER